MKIFSYTALMKMFNTSSQKHKVSLYYQTLASHFTVSHAGRYLTILCHDRLSPSTTLILTSTPPLRYPAGASVSVSRLSGRRHSQGVSARVSAYLLCGTRGRRLCGRPLQQLPGHILQVSDWCWVGETNNIQRLILNVIHFDV